MSAIPSKEGESVPSFTFVVRENNEWKKVSTDEIFKGKTVVVFSLPGAFTPTCSSSHLPRYEELTPVLKENGVDDVYCISVNDTFVMNAWAKDQNIKNVKLIPDGTGEFTKGMGALVDKSDLGFGMRSWRYSMLVKDGKVVKQFIEPKKEGDPFEVSDADTMLKHINPEAKTPTFVTIFTKPGCPFCAKAKDLLRQHGYEWEEISVGREGVTSKTIRAMTDRSTVPQVYIGGKYIGGASDLEAHFKKN